MSDVARITGTFEVTGSHAVTISAPIDDEHDPEKIADLLYAGDPGISICRQCADDIDSPESGDLASFTVVDHRGVVTHYVPNPDGGWKVED